MERHQDDLPVLRPHPRRSGQGNGLLHEAPPWKGLPDDVKHDILYGHDFKVNVSYRNRWGRLREYSTGFEGVIRTLMRRHDETDSQSMREYYESYMREVPCQVCHGRRLKPEVLAVTVDGKSIFDVCDMPVVRELAWINGLKLEGSAQLIAGEVLKEIKARLGFLNDVGLDYLTLARGRHPVRRRSAAHPTRHADRLRPGRRHVRARRAVHRPAPA